MNNSPQQQRIVFQIAASARIVIVTMMICCFLYPLVILGMGQLLVPYTANGSLIYSRNGEIIGSEVIAQGFSREKYFRPRPSAVGYNASAAGGSNWSPTNPSLRSRAEIILAALKNRDGKMIPADLVTASGSGLDPHITLGAAEYQAERVSAARGLPHAVVMKMIRKHTMKPEAGVTGVSLINVLFLNMELDSMEK
jgi:potassium-transporting ATPase KdpC subunit